MEKQQKFLFSILIGLLVAFGFHEYFNRQVTFAIETAYLQGTLDEQVLIDLINSNAMQRLKKINQYGVEPYVRTDIPEYTRYGHSLGVFALCRRFGAPLKEQIAALLHDVSHTAFSHVGDVVYPAEGREDSYQDTIHEKYLGETDVADILATHGYSVDEICHKNDGYSCLESSYPDICADRLEYNLNGGLLENIITEQQIEHILDHLHFANGQWYFDEPEAAELFARTALQLTEDHWATDWNGAIMRLFGDTIAYALEKGILSEQEFHHGTDDEIWNTLNNSQDLELIGLLELVRNYQTSYLTSGAEDYDYTWKNKFRAIDPWVGDGDDLGRLSNSSEGFALEFQRVKDKLADPVFLKKSPSSLN